MRWLYILLSVILLTAGAAAKKADEPLDALKARAETAKPSDQARLFATIAGREVSEADHFYTEGDIDRAKISVEVVVRYADRAGAAAKNSGKHLKDTEIQLRQTARRLDDLRKTVNFEDRADLENAVKEVEKTRQELLDHMFGPPPKERKQ